MRRTYLLLVDLAIVAITAVLAVVLRDNLELKTQSFDNLIPYISLNISVAVPIIISHRLNSSIWRYSGLADLVPILSATVLIVTLSTTASFVWARMDGVARSLPVLHGVLMFGAMVSARYFMRLLHVRRQAMRPLPVPVPLASTNGFVQESVLIIGVNEVSRLFLDVQAHSGAPRIAGIISHSPKHGGRSLGTYRILGDVADLDLILRDLEVHGVFVTRVLLVVPFAALSPDGQIKLQYLQDTSDIRVDRIDDFFNADGLSARVGHVRGPSMVDSAQVALPQPRQAVRPPMYHAIKRPLDFIAALAAVTILAPIIVLVFVVNGIDLKGWPVFWQQRPGRNGKPINVLKFRTMGSAYDEAGRSRNDAERMTRFGHILRRSRLDELPQLFNVLRGEMSFIGPRPLLPRDQPDDARGRLMVRPGITGYAQVNGGRLIDREKKADLDDWYVENASLWLDLKIAFKTLMTMISGDQAQSTRPMEPAE